MQSRLRQQQPTGGAGIQRAYRIRTHVSVKLPEGRRWGFLLRKCCDKYHIRGHRCRSVLPATRGQHARRRPSYVQLLPPRRNGHLLVICCKLYPTYQQNLLRCRQRHLHVLWNCVRQCHRGTAQRRCINIISGFYAHDIFADYDSLLCIPISGMPRFLISNVYILELALYD